MAIFDLANSTKNFLSVFPNPHTSTATGATVDTAGFSSVLMTIDLSAEKDTLSNTVYQLVVMEHSDSSGSGFAAVESTDVANGFIATVNRAGPVAQGGVVLTVDGTGTVSSSGNGNHPKNPGTYGAVWSVGYIGAKRYVRGMVYLFGTHSNGTITGVNFVLGNPIHSSDTTLANLTALG